MLRMTCRLDAEALLALWERTLGQGAAARDAALLDAALLDGFAQRRSEACTLGERNTLLLGLHAQLFGSELALRSHCPACGTAAQFSSDCEAITAQLPPTLVEPPPHRIETQGHAIEFRLPDQADIAAAAAGVAVGAGAGAGAATGDSDAPDDAGFALELLARCVVACTRNGEPVPVRTLPAPLLDALSQSMEVLDPAASIGFGLECPQCATPWEARLDVGQLLWAKVQAAAERVLLDVDALARAYGWSEPEVLRLSPTRRAAYLQLAAA